MVELELYNHHSNELINGIAFGILINIKIN